MSNDILPGVSEKAIDFFQEKLEKWKIEKIANLINVKLKVEKEFDERILYIEKEIEEIKNSEFINI